MRIGVPTEIRQDEYRVALTPAGTKELTSRGHEVLVQHGAGEGSFFADEAYVAAGARIVPDAGAVFAQARTHRADAVHGIAGVDTGCGAPRRGHHKQAVVGRVLGMEP